MAMTFGRPLGIGLGLFRSVLRVRPAMGGVVVLTPVRLLVCVGGEVLTVG